MNKMIKKKVALEIKNEAEKYRLLEAEKWIKKLGYIYDAKSGKWIEKK